MPVANPSSIQEVTTGVSISSNPTYKTAFNISSDSRWWTTHLDNLVRTFEPTKNDDWCIPEKFPTHEWSLVEHDNKARGLIYIKNYKASSSTLEGVSINIAHHVARRKQSSNLRNVRPCIHYNRHVFQDVGALQFRADPSFLWTMVRNPMHRDLSSFYFFEVSRHLVSDTTENILQSMKNHKSFQTMYLFPWTAQVGRNIMLNQNPAQIAVVVQQMKESILDEYNFIGIVERMDESLAVLVLLLGLEPADVVTLSAKRAGGYDDGEGKYGDCVKIAKQPPPSQRPPELQDYLYHEHAKENADFLLYEAVNRSLDKTIECLGVDKVRATMSEIQKLQKLAEEHCQEAAKFPCSAEGVFQPKLAKQSCYVQDAGCGHACVDSVLARYNAGLLQ